MSARSTAEAARADRSPSRPSEPRVLAIVVTHDGRTWLRDCLVSLSQQTHGALDVLVIDDASPDAREKPALKRIAKRHLRRRRWGFVRTPRPLGFGGAINWALSRVRTDADLLLFMHDDVALTEDSIAVMAHRLVTEESTAIVGPKVVAWDDPSQLEEVGMATDRFGYPYKGLEQGEIDLGQHDTPADVFYVTSTCLLIEHEAFRDLGGWDARMRAFSEDLDLCWRARLAGRSVRVEPAAQARHAIAMATGQRRTRWTPIRYYIRRNRLRTVIKNASGLRLIGQIPQFLLLAIAEMLGFILLRQPREVLNLGRALIWNLGTLPQTLSERRRVQRTRQVDDAELKRLIVRQSARVRVYVANQADRLEEAWGRRAEVFAARARQAKQATSLVSGRHVALVALVALTLLWGFRHYVFGTPAAFGELLPFPQRPTGMWRAYLSPWQSAGLGWPGGGPPAFLFLGFFPVLTLGAASLAQKVLLAVLGTGAFIGAYRLAAGFGGRTPRLVTASVYTFSALGYVGVRSGALGALVLGAAAPFAILSIFKLTGWYRPGGSDRGREVARLMVTSAVAAAFVPGSLVMFAVVALMLAGIQAWEKEASFATVRGPLLGLLGAWVLLLPWSAGWLSAGGVLERLTDGQTWRLFAANFDGHGMASLLTGQTPEGPVLLGLVLPLLGVIAAVTGAGIRRRIALAMWFILGMFGLWITLISRGAIRPIVGSPIEASVIPMLAWSLLAGVAVAAFRTDLPKRGLGAIHALTVGSLAVAGFLVVAGLGPTLTRGEWVPGAVEGRVSADIVDQVGTLLRADASTSGRFRTLWVGDRWTSRSSAAIASGRNLLSGSRGRILPELFERSKPEASRDLDRVIASVEEGATDRGGALLGAFNIRFVVLERGASADPWLAQRDLALARIEPAYLLLQNTTQIERAGVYTEFPIYVKAIDENDPNVPAAPEEIERVPVTQQSPSRYRAKNVSGPGVVFLAEAADDGWTATLSGVSLTRIDGGWGNAFQVPAELEGDLVIRFSRSALQWLLLGLLALLWLAILGAAFSRRSRPRGST